MSNDQSAKIRHLLPMLQDAIVYLTDLAPDLAKLEYYNNDDASRRVKLALVNFEKSRLKPLKEGIMNIRETINQNKNQSKKQKPCQNQENLKQ
jgi:hypothetical protein